MAFGKISSKPLSHKPIESQASIVPPSRPAPTPERNVMPEIKPEDEGDSEDGEGALPGHYIGTLR
jgi:hypothetical protein